MGLGPEVERCFEACAARRVANFYGYQRFGLKGGVNRKVGKAIVQKDFARAVQLILSEPRAGEDERVVEARRLCARGSYSQALPLFSRHQDIELGMARHLSMRPDDHIGALRRMPIAIRRLLVNSYQSYLFNLTLSRAVAEGLDISRAQDGDNWAPLEESGLSVGKIHGVKEAVAEDRECIPLIQIVGYAHRDYGSRFDRMLSKVIGDEDITPGSFYIKEAEEMSSEGGFRPAPLLSNGPVVRERGERVRSGILARKRRICDCRAQRDTEAGQPSTDGVLGVQETSPSLRR